ncbi:MAG TPA: glycosyltransferase [Longimicrobium sp.]|nr:glycosyltransferase [Longimicrobium sp.]
MRVLIGAFGTRGDVQPMLAVAQALIARGHSASLAVPPNLVGLARGVGLDAFGVGIDYEEISRRGANGSFREMVGVMPLVRADVRVQLAAMEERAAQADLLVGSSVFTVGSVLSEMLGKPYVFFAYCPQLFPSGDHPSPMIPWHPLPRWVNRLTWAGFKPWWQFLLRQSINEMRAERRLAPIDDVWATLVGKTPVLACDAALAPAPTDYDVPVTQTGVLLMREDGDLSPEVRAFLEAGPPPVYIGFGSMSDPDPRQTTERILESVRRAGVRALISRGWAGLSAESVPKDVLFLGPEPHRKLFPRCAAVVHHGGAGTTHAAALAGVPQVVMPQLLDQHYWAYRLRLAGLGPRVPRHAKDPEMLARALRTCVQDEALRQRARALAASMRTDGTEQVADLLERLAGVNPGAVSPGRASSARATG